MMMSRSLVGASIAFVLFFLFLEVFVSSVIPAMFSTFHIPQFMPLFVLFMGIKWDSPLRPIYILILNLIHASFSTEGWAIGTFLGVLLAWPLSYLREIAHFGSTFVLIIFSFLFHIVWFYLGTFVFAMKNDQYHLLGDYSLSILLKSILLALLTPILFKILDRFWMFNGDQSEQRP